MNIDERDKAGHRIYAGAIPVEPGRYLAAVVVKRLKDDREVFRDEALSSGYQWPDPEAALAFALRAGEAVVAPGGLA